MFTGLTEKMKSSLFLRILGFMQVLLCSKLIAETLIFMTAMLFGEHHLYSVCEAQFTLQGAKLVGQTLNCAVLGWCSLQMF